MRQEKGQTGLAGREKSGKKKIKEQDEEEGRPVSHRVRSTERDAEKEKDTSPEAKETG